MSRSHMVLKFQRSFGEACWRARFIDSDEGFHAVEYRDRYECHIDRKDPLKDAWGHLVEDSPGTLSPIATIGILMTIFGLIYYLSSKE